MMQRKLVYLAAAMLVGFLIGDVSAQEKPAAQFVLPETDEGLAGDGPIRRYPWFQDVWNERRTSFAKNAEAKKGSVVFLGDSITQGWSDDFGGAFAGMNAANRGISGDTTRGMLLRLKEDILDLEPAAVVMLMGTNDLEEKAEPETIAGNVQLIIGALKKSNPKMPIIWCHVFPSSAGMRRPVEKIKKINQLCAAAVKGDSQITVLDTWTLFANKAGDAKKEEFPDLLHPNKLGYEKWELALKPVLESKGLMPTKADDFQCEQGFEKLFNGEDLDGWGYRRTSDQMRKSAARWQSRSKDAPAWPFVDEPVMFDDKTVTPEGRYLANNGRLVVMTPPEGRKIQQIWTQKEFAGDFELILEFRATPNADSGIFLRGPQLQCRDFALAGPYKKLKKYRSGHWNEIIIKVKGETALVTCNGEVIEKAMKVPTKKGPIGLEGDRGQVEYRRIRIKQAD